MTPRKDDSEAKMRCKVRVHRHENMQPSSIVVNQLLTNARAGSSSAVEELLAAYGDYLRILAGQRLGGTLAGRLSPSDLVQETLLAAWKDFDTISRN